MNIKRIPFVYIAVIIGIADIIADNVMNDEHRLILGSTMSSPCYYTPSPH